MRRVKKGGSKNWIYMWVMKKFISEFKEFISKGNVLDMAVGVIIGGAFSKIVSSLVKFLTECSRFLNCSILFVYSY